MSLTTSEILQIAAYSQSLATKDILNSGLYGGGMDLQLPRKIYCVRQNLKWMYNLDNSNTSLTGVGNYLIALCNKYFAAARPLITSGGSISPITPTAGAYLIPITGAEFTDATHYDDGRIIGKQLVIFWNDVNRYLLSSEFAMTATGINILVAGFDATANPSYELFIYIVNP